MAVRAKKISDVQTKSFDSGVRRVRRRGPLSDVWSFIVWLVGIIVALAVGFGMTDGTLSIPLIPEIITIAAGWIVIVLALLGVLLKIIDALNV